MHLLVEIGVKRNASLGATLVALMMHYAASCIIKTLEQERHAIDAVLLSTFGDAELRFGVRAPGGWVLKQRSRTSWDYDSEVRDAIKGLQVQAQRDGRAQPLLSTHLLISKETRQEGE